MSPWQVRPRFGDLDCRSVWTDHGWIPYPETLWYWEILAVNSFMFFPILYIVAALTSTSFWELIKGLASLCREILAHNTCMVMDFEYITEKWNAAVWTVALMTDNSVRDHMIKCADPGKKILRDHMILITLCFSGTSMLPFFFISKLNLFLLLAYIDMGNLVFVCLIVRYRIHHNGWKASP